MYLVNHYIIDWDKVETLEDVKTILKDSDLGFDYVSDDLKKLCNYVSKETGKIVIR